MIPNPITDLDENQEDEIDSDGDQEISSSSGFIYSFVRKLEN